MVQVYQVYNPQNKQWVKMRNGQVLENSYFQFPDVPIFGNPGTEPEIKGEPDEQDPDQDPEHDPENDGSGGFTFMEDF